MSAPNTLSGRPNTSGTRAGVKGQSPFPLATDDYDKDNEQKFRRQLGDILEPLRKQLAATATLLAAIKASTVVNDSTVTGAHVSDALDWLKNNTQPLDADLTAIAALTTDTYGRSLLTATSALSIRSSAFLNIESATGHGDSNYTILATDRVVYTNAAFTASRTWTLPAANSVNPGTYLLVTDLQLTLTPTNTLIVQRAGSDVIDQAFTSVTMDHAGHAYLFVSDGTSKWRRTSLRTYGNSANNAVVLDGSGKLPAVDGSQLTGLAGQVVPTVQTFTSGSSATYTPTSGTKWIRVRMIGGGGGGGAAATNAGGTGGTTSFGSWTAIGGTGGNQGGLNAIGGPGGTGGAAGTGTLVVRLQGGSGGSGMSGPSGNCGMAGGLGGAGPFGGGGRGGTSTGTPAGGAAPANTGAGGGGAGFFSASPNGSAGGGGAGEYVEFYVNAPGNTTYTVGAAGSAGAAGTNAGGAGAAGIIVIEEFH